MTNIKVTGMTAIAGASISTTDIVPLIDVSDTSMAATGTNKKTTIADLGVAIGGSLVTIYVDSPGGTDDTALFTAAEAALPSEGGRIWLKAGAYALPSGYSFTKPVRLEGQGMGNPYGWNITGYSGAYPPPRLLRGITSIIVSSTSTGGLGFAAAGSSIQDLAVINTSSTDPTAGVGVSFALASLCRIDRCAITGFYDCVDINNGGLWAISGAYIANPVRYGVRIRNVNTPDEGDGFIGNGSAIYAITRDGASAGVQWESGGGLKLLGLKINGAPGVIAFAVGVRFATASVTTSVGTINGCSIENTDTCIELARQGASGGYNLLNIVGNEFGVGSNGSSSYGVLVSTAGFDNLNISDNVFAYVRNPICINYGTGVRVGTNIHSGMVSAKPAVAIGSGATLVHVAPQHVTIDSSYVPLVKDESTNSALVDYRYQHKLGTITAADVSVYTMFVKQNQAGTFTFNIVGTAVGVGPFNYSGTRSFTRTTGNVTVATVGTDSLVGAASSDVDLVVDTTTTSGVVEFGVKLKSGATATDLDGVLMIDVKGGLSELREWA